MLILNANKFLATLLIALSCSLECFADIPSSRGENTVSIGTGFPGIINTSYQGFYEFNNRYGIGAGVSFYLLYAQYYTNFRFHNSETLSTSIFLEGGQVGTVAKYGAIGFGFSKTLSNGRLDASIAFSQHPEEQTGLGTGFKITQKSGLFYGISLIRSYIPTVAIGKTIQLSLPTLSFEKTKSGEIRD